MVPIPNFLQQFNEKFLIVGSSSVLADRHRELGLSVAEASTRIGVSKHTYQKKIFPPKDVSIWFLKKFGILDPDIFDRIYLNAPLQLTARSIRVTLPIEISAELAYYVGYLQGDGCLTADGIQVRFTDEYVEQIQKMSALSQSLFGVSGKIRLTLSPLSGNRTPNLEIRNRVLNTFFHVVFELPKGRKKDLKIPSLIKRDPVLLKPYLAGLYDADGTLPKNPRACKQLFLDITLKDRSFIEEIQRVLATFGIETLKIFERVKKFPIGGFVSKTYEIRIRKKRMILKFLQTIGFCHPDKQKRAKQLLELMGP